MKSHHPCPFFGPFRTPGKRLRAVLALAGFAWIGALPALAALPEPLVHLRFSEVEDGGVTANGGSLGGDGVLAMAEEWPAFTSAAPSGPFTPPSNTRAMDFGPSPVSQGGRAVDLFTQEGDGTLGPMEAFTVLGWLNARELTEGRGGNRIAFALASAGGPGFDLVQLGNGSLRIGVNNWPDAGGGGPISTPGHITADPALGAGNWVFFAATYDSAAADGEVRYYFGSGQALATLASTHAYPQGQLFSSGVLTLGNFGSFVAARTGVGGNNSRAFRGAIDELRVFDAALSLEQVQEAQLDGTVPPQPVTITTPPASRTVYENTAVNFTVAHTGTTPFTYQWQRDGVDIPGATASAYTLASAVLADTGAKFRVKISNAVTPEIISEEATLTVRADSDARVALSFSESNAFATNYGTLGGTGAYVANNGFPLLSSNIPAGPLAPTNNLSSVDFGKIDAGQGGRAIDFTNPFDNTLGSLRAFTITGWLNSADLRTGGGGNRLTFALATPGGPGLDLVQLGNGSLRLGVNAWPDNASIPGPASSEGVITADPENGAGNWVYFAVTYDSALEAENVTYYFGSPTSEAEPDLTATYLQGPIATSGTLTVGNFGSIVGARTAAGPTASRVFRGLIDELNIFSRALTLDEIRAQQKAAAVLSPDFIPVSVVTAPQNVTLFEGSDALFEVSAEGTPPLTYQWWRRQGGVAEAIPGATGPKYTLPAPPASAAGAEFWVVAANQATSATSTAATLTVLPEDNLKVKFSFSEGEGETTANAGNLGGSGTIVAVNGFPLLTSQVPAGPFAPEPNAGSIDFGIIEDGEGGRSVTFGGGVFGAQAGPMKAFTLTGWLNCRSLFGGKGGNRIISAHETNTGPGFDLVVNMDGTLQLGVNAWSDFPTPGPLSSPMVTEDLEAGDGNWLFFAVTYDGEQAAGNVAYYFGTPQAAAELDAVLDYPKGPFASTGMLAVGNFSPSESAHTATGANSRNFRGLLDELRVVNRALSLEEIRSLQTDGREPPQPETVVELAIAHEGENIVLTWRSTQSLRLQTSTSLVQGSWADVPAAPVVAGDLHTVTIPAARAEGFYRLVK